MKRTQATIAILALLAGGSTFLASRAGARSAAPEQRTRPRPAVEITIDNFAFGQKEVTVDRGTTVTWRNRDDMPHTVVASDRSFQSPALDTGDRFSHAFDRPGTYDYFCSIHPHMTGRIVVR